MRELTSGIDALYLSGRPVRPLTDLLERLAAAREEAESLEGGVPFDLGGQEFMVAPRGLGKYRYWLSHRSGQVGVTPSERLPAFRIQPSAEVLHGLGVEGTVSWFRGVLESECSSVLLTVSRVDLHADFQGWQLDGDDRKRFVCRADARTTHEDGEAFTGFEFGRRATKTVCARIYDKTADVAKKGSDYWFDIWGKAYDEGSPVLRVEFEINREGLRQYGLHTPEQVLLSAGAVWADLTATWLSFRQPAADQTRSRWPIADQWRCIQRARIADGAFDVKRMFAGRLQGNLRRLAPCLVGSLTSFAVIAECNDWEQTSVQLSDFLLRYGAGTENSFENRVAEKRRKRLLP